MSRATLDTAHKLDISCTWLSHSLAGLPKPFYYTLLTKCSPQPLNARTQVWALPISLAATFGIDVSFSSSAYLDVSVQRVPSVSLWIHDTVTGVCPAGFPHSEICGSLNMCFSPQLIAACHVLLRLPVPGHPPCALFA